MKFNKIPLETMAAMNQVRGWFIGYAVACYTKGQLPLEFLIHTVLEKMGRHPAAALNAKRRGSLERVFDRLKGVPVVWCFGGGAPSSNDNEANKGVVHAVGMIHAIIKKLVEGDISIVTGSSPNGIMREYDVATMVARTMYKLTKSLLVHIPLKFLVNGDGPREDAVDVADEGCKAPRRAELGCRTQTFTLLGWCMGVLVGPGGIGTVLELAWVIEEIKFRATRLTCFSNWPKEYLPPIVMIDYFMHDHSRWFHDGMILDLETRVLGGMMKQELLEKTFVIRVGKGKDVTPKAGVQVRYFETPEAAAEFVKELFLSDPTSETQAA